jgi:uncharacterized membrane protein
MAYLAWVKIWPAQLAVYESVRARRAPDPRHVAASQRALKHSAYLAVPLVLTMLVVHKPILRESGIVGILLTLAISLGVTSLLYPRLVHGEAAAPPAPSPRERGATP